MALFLPGPTVAAVSGSVGGTTFSRNRGGMYMRNRSMPSNPQSSYQVNIRSILANLSANFASLTDAQQEAWRSYANQTPVTNALGARQTLTGHQAYIAINHRLLQAGASLLTLPPLGAAPGGLLTFSAAADASDGSCDLTFTATPIGADNQLVVSGCVVRSAGIKYVRGFLKQLVISAKNQATALDVGPELILRFGTLQENDVVHLRASILDSTTGLLSQPLAAVATVAA